MNVSGCRCPDGAECRLSVLTESKSTSDGSEGEVSALLQWAMTASYHDILAEQLRSRADPNGYVVVSHLLPALKRVRADTRFGDVRVIAKGLAKSPFFRVTKAGSSSVRVQPRHPHAHEVLALAAPFVGEVTSGQAEAGTRQEHLLGPRPLDRVVEPSVLKLYQLLQCKVGPPMPSAHSGHSAASQWHQLLTRPAHKLVAAARPGTVEALWLAQEARGTGPASTSKPALPTASIYIGPVDVPRPAFGPSITTLPSFRQWVQGVLAQRPSQLALKAYHGPIIAAEKAMDAERRRVHYIALCADTGSSCLVDVRSMHQAEAPPQAVADDMDMDQQEEEEDQSTGGQEYYGRQLHPLLPLLLDPSICKVLHHGSEDVMWLQAEAGLPLVNAWDTFLAVDEAFTAAARPAGMSLKQLVPDRLDDRASFHTLRYTPSLACLQVPSLAGNVMGLADPAALHKVMWQEEGGRTAVTADDLSTFPLSTAVQSTLLHEVSCMLPAANAVKAILLQWQGHSGQATAASGRECLPASRLVRHVLSACGLGPASGPASVSEVSSGEYPVQPGSPLARAAARGHLTCLRVPPYDAFQRLVLHVPLLVPPWYLSCKTCGGHGHFEVDCPAHAAAFADHGS